MKTNAMINTKEVELSEWIREQMREYRMDPDECAWVAMDEDGTVSAFSVEPEKCFSEKHGGFWSNDGESCLLGDVPEHLLLWPWGEFLLQWGPKPAVLETVEEWADRKLAEAGIGRVPVGVAYFSDGSEKVFYSGAGRLESAATVPQLSPSPALPLPAFQREVWAADVMSEAYRITVAIVEEALPAPQEVPHWRLPTDEELDRLLPGGWTERCPLEF